MSEPECQIGDRDYCLVCGGLIGYEDDLLCAFCQGCEDDLDEDDLDKDE